MANQILTLRKLQQSTTGYGILLVLIMLIGGYFGYQNYTEYQAAGQALDNEQAQLNQLRGSADKTKTDFLALKTEFDLKNNGLNQSIDKLLPSEEKFTDLARSLDEYFRNTTTSGNPMFMSDLRFNQARVEKNKDYNVLPFSMSITGNEDGLKDFLKYIENSGGLSGTLADQIRLMDINSINLSFQNNSSNSNQNVSGNEAISNLLQARSINATINLDAYFQKPLEETQQ